METKKNKLFIDCDEAMFICDKSQYNESTFWERFRLNIRYIYCHITRSYVKKNKKLSSLKKIKINTHDNRCSNICWHYQQQFFYYNLYNIVGS